MEQAWLFAEEQIPGHRGDMRGEEQPDERQQLRILQELVRLLAVRAEFADHTSPVIKPSTSAVKVALRFYRWLDHATTSSCAWRSLRGWWGHRGANLPS